MVTIGKNNKNSIELNNISIEYYSYKIGSNNSMSISGSVNEWWIIFNFVITIAKFKIIYCS